LKNQLKEKYGSYDEQSDSFFGITSKYLPIHSDFIKFWESTITMSSGLNSTSSSLNSTFSYFENDLEIDELCSLFKLWGTNNGVTTTCGNITEENVLKILKHFFPCVEIVDEKYVLNVNCVTWNKTSDIDKAFKYIREKIVEDSKTSVIALISFDDAYNYYYKYCKLNNANKFIVSKRYFEKYLYYKLVDHIVYEKFIETKWLMNNV
jgi:hypothetical protein